jgi:hypothetical protein
LEPVNDSNIHPNESGYTAVIPCIAKDPAVKVELYRVIAPSIYRLVSASETMLQSVHKLYCQPLSHITDFNIQRPRLTSLKLKNKLKHYTTCVSSLADYIFLTVFWSFFVIITIYINQKVNYIQCCAFFGVYRSCICTLKGNQALEWMNRKNCIQQK